METNHEITENALNPDYEKKELSEPYDYFFINNDSNGKMKKDIKTAFRKFGKEIVTIVIYTSNINPNNNKKLELKQFKEFIPKMVALKIIKKIEPIKYRHIIKHLKEKYSLHS